MGKKNQCDFVKQRGLEVNQLNICAEIFSTAFINLWPLSLARHKLIILMIWFIYRTNWQSTQWVIPTHIYTRIWVKHILCLKYAFKTFMGISCWINITTHKPFFKVDTFHSFTFFFHLPNEIGPHYKLIPCELNLLDQSQLELWRCVHPEALNALWKSRKVA